MPAPSLPLLCPIYGGPMRIIAFITHSADIGQILDHIGVGSEPPNIASAHGPPLSPLSPLWAGCGAHSAEGSQVESDWSSDWDLAAQAAPDDEANQRIHWLGRKNSDACALRDRAARAAATSHRGPQRQGLWVAASPESAGSKGAWWPKTCAVFEIRWLEFLSPWPRPSAGWKPAAPPANQT